MLDEDKNFVAFQFWILEKRRLAKTIYAILFIMIHIDILCMAVVPQGDFEIDILAEYMIRDCAIIIRRGGHSKTRGRGAQCKLTALGRGVTCKFLRKWGGGWQLKN